MIRALVAALVLSVAGLAGAQELTPEQEARYGDLIHEFRCTVCQNQTIGDSNADLAADLRNQVRAHVAAGASDDDVRQYLMDRYGDFILYKPRFIGRTFLLWTGPFLLLAVALFVAVRVLRRRPAVAAVPIDPERVRRLLDEERG